ncbi:hypothetical protein AVEN_97903-1 [Araneus ventricosus]|uniref:Uncharacterized protein n=1 Tax=Araneus ventricosus TaxID=182803 RepID=A0A4Y2HU39_ARAVE|nr:hypothetical protein AVEN_97903-1 [Araneus ventricosus]
MGCGASVDGDSDSQASLEEWEKMQRRRRSVLSDVSDAESENSVTFQKDIQEKAMKASGFQRSLSLQQWSKTSACDQWSKTNKRKLLHTVIDPLKELIRGMKLLQKANKCTSDRNIQLIQFKETKRRLTAF